MRSDGAAVNRAVYNQLADKLPASLATFQETNYFYGASKKKIQTAFRHKVG